MNGFNELFYLNFFKEKLERKKSAILIFIVVVTFFYQVIFVLIKAGLFYKITIKKEYIPQIIMITLKEKDKFSSHQVIEKTFYALFDEKIRTFKNFRIFFEYPIKFYGFKNYKTIAGCLIPKEALGKIKKDKNFNKYMIFKLPAELRIFSQFPLNNKISIFLGRVKFIRALSNLKVNNLRDNFVFLEICDSHRKKISFIVLENASNNYKKNGF